MRSRSKAAPELKHSAPIFAALADEARLRIIRQLCDLGPMSITGLTSGSRVTRQAITKHLHRLQRAGIVCSHWQGRENVWQLDQSRLAEARRYLETISIEWDQALARLRSFVEEGKAPH